MNAADCPAHHELAAGVPEDALPLFCDCSRPGTCPNCGPTGLEAHPRHPVFRCQNCKEWLADAWGRPLT